MKRNTLIKHLTKNGAYLIRQGRRHSIYQRAEYKTEVPNTDSVEKNLQRSEHSVCEMKYRAVIKRSGDGWIGWLIDLPGVNAQERSRDELLESLRIGAEDMLATDVPFISDAQLTMIDVPNPNWLPERA